MKVKYILVVSGIICALSACKKNDEKDPYAFNVSSIPAVSDAKLMLVFNDNAISANTENARLYKITNTDQIIPASFTDNNGDDVSSKFLPGQISNANPDFMLINFTRGMTGVPNEGYLMKKSDGSLVKVNDYGVPFVSNGSSLNHPFTYYNGSSYIYCLAGDQSTQSQLIRISTANPNFISTSKVTADSIRTVYGFEVDANNNVLSELRTTTGNNYLLAFNSTNAKIVKTGFYPWYWLNGNGDLSYRDGSSLFLQKITSNGSNPLTVSDDVKYTLSAQLYRDKSYRVTYDGKFIMVSDSKLYELDNASHTPKEITTVPFKNQKWIDHSQTNGLLFIAGENASGQQTIFKINLASNYAHTTYPTPGKYNFYEIEAFEDGTIYATAKRNSDGKNVILKFSADGTETLLDETLNRKGIWLEKVSEFTNN